jgi:hypothetical protein
MEPGRSEQVEGLGSGAAALPEKRAFLNSGQANLPAFWLPSPADICIALDTGLTISKAMC